MNVNDTKYYIKLIKDYTSDKQKKKILNDDIQIPD